MYNYNSLEERSKRHYTEAHIKENKTFIKDPACVICYPPREIDEKFYKFWDWYGTELPVTTYSATTIRIFQELLSRDINEKSQTQTKLLQIIGSIRYSEEPDLTIPDIAIKILERIVCSEGFELSNEQTEQNIELSYGRAESTKEESLPESSSEEKENSTPEKESPEQTETEQEELFDIGFEEEIEIILKSLESINTELKDSSIKNSDSEKSEELIELINNEDLEIASETESEYNLNLLFEENIEIMNAGEHRAELERIFGIGGIRLKPNLVNYPIFDGEEEDPRDWLTKFNHAATTNELPDDQKMRVAIGHLKGIALEWYQGDQANIVQWHIDNNNDNFDDRLITHFTTPQKREKWNMEIANIKQKDQETVKEYTRRFNTLVKRIRNVPDELQRVYFRNGLLPLIKLETIKGRPADLATMIEIAEIGRASCRE